MNKTLLFLLLVFCGLPKTVAQVHATVVDAESGEPLLGALVQTEGLSTTTDTAGRCTMYASFPAMLTVYHLGYVVWQDSVHEPGAYTIRLQPTSTTLSDVVVTGQFEAQSARNSIYKVRSLSANRLAAQGAVSLQDALVNELNIRFSRDNATGSSGLNFQGLSGKYTKVLLDGVPLTGKGGVGDEIDLTQIDVTNVDRIELVEGPMAVNYGADALGGVINIITKKPANKVPELTLSLHEETVGKEYGLWQQGIHSPTMRWSQPVSSALGIQVNLRADRFGGWQGTGVGRDKSWYPKTQYFGGFLAQFRKKDISLYYRADYQQATLENLGLANASNPLRDPFAVDEEYAPRRLMHQLQAEWDLGQRSVHSVVSYTHFERSTRQFTKNLVTGAEQTTRAEEQDTLYYKTFFYRHTMNHALRWAWGTLQLGTDGTVDRAGGTTLSAGEKHQTDLGFFANSELTLANWQVRPGIRLTHNSQYATVPSPAVNLKYTPVAALQIRAGYGRGYRAPSLREQYHEFIDANHNIVGNADLRPEYSHSVNLDLTWQRESKPLSLNWSGFYNDINDQITYFTPTEANRPTTYVNLLKYKTAGTMLTGTFTQGALRLNSGFSWIGLYQRLSEVAAVPSMRFSPSANFNTQYALPKTGITISTFYKYTGARRQYLLGTNESGEDEVQLRQVADFHLLDVTLSKQWSRLTVTGGARNLLNVISVANNLGGDVHGSGSGQTPVAYGRSWFLRLQWSLLPTKN